MRTAEDRKREAVAEVSCTGLEGALDCVSQRLQSEELFTTTQKVRNDMCTVGLLCTDEYASSKFGKKFRY